MPATVSSGKCVCPSCGYREDHITGMPCFRMSCPQCHTPLERGRISTEEGEELIIEDQSLPMHGKQGLKPVVDNGSCIACGICIDNCPLNAISLREGVAHISRNTCNNCGICLDICPSEAIHPGM